MKLAGAVVAAALTGVALGWSATVTLAPPPEVTQESAYSTAAVEYGSVGYSIETTVESSWPVAETATSRSAGIVTTVYIADGSVISAGSRLFDVGTRPVFAASGDVPAYRSMQQGITGPDVAQLQALLASQGYFAGAADGRFGAATRRAVKAWQAAAGVTADGVVQLGDVIFLTTLPARVELSEQLAKDATLSGSDVVFSTLGSSPDLILSVSESRAGTIPPATEVIVHALEGDVRQQTGERVVDEETGSVEIHLEPPPDGSPCACDAVAAWGVTTIPATVVVVPRRTGLTVPSSAVWTGPDGDVVVIDEAGRAHPVSIVAQAQGITLIQGARRDWMVRVPAHEQE